MNNEFKELIGFVLEQHNVEHTEEDIDALMMSYGLRYNSKFKEVGTQKISIPLSEEDLQQLQNGETFDWTFDEIDVHLSKSEEEDEQDNEDGEYAQ